jgi:hypothetical protein
LLVQCKELPLTRSASKTPKLLPSPTFSHVQRLRKIHYQPAAPHRSLVSIWDPVLTSGRELLIEFVLNA